MVLWLVMLPLALWAKCGWGTPWAVALVSLALLTIGEFTHSAARVMLQ